MPKKRMCDRSQHRAQARIVVQPRNGLQQQHYLCSECTTQLLTDTVASVVNPPHVEVRVFPLER